MLIKYQLFGIFNLLIIFGLLFIATKIVAIPTPVAGTTFEFSWETIPAYLPKLIVIFSLIANLFITYKLIFKKETQNFKLYIFWTLATVIWIPLTFIGYFFASSPTFLLTCIALIVFAHYFIQKVSKKTALFISLLTFIVVMFSIAASFEENYCWEKGDEELAKNGQEWITLSKEEAEKLNGAAGMDLKEGSQVSPHFKAHFLCHRNFNFIEALKEKYLFSK